MADHFTTCRVINKHDDLHMTLCTEWLTDSSFKIIIFLSAESTPLVGEMRVKDAENFAKNLSKTRSEYLDSTRSVLSGKDSGVEFILKDSKLRWKKGLWNHGMLDVVPIPLTQVFSEILEKLLLRHRDLEDRVDGLKSENEALRITRNELNNKLEEIIVLKKGMEEDLYRRFIVVLNSKKARIRELETQLKKKTGSDKIQSVYEEKTDESEGSDEPKEVREVVKSQSRKDSTHFLSRISGFGGNNREEKLTMRRKSDSDGKMTDSDYEDERKTRRTWSKSANKTGKIKNSKDSCEPSTSKKDDKLNDCRKGDKTGRISSPTPNASRLNFDSEESEEDMFS